MSNTNSTAKTNPADIKIYAFADEAGGKISEQIAAMKRNGLAGVELRGTEYGNVSDLSKENAKEIIRKLNDEGLEVWSLGSPLGKISIYNEFEPEIEKLKRTLDIADTMSARNIRMFSFYLPKNEPYEKYRTKVLDRLAKMAEVAQGSGVTLCHENEKGIYGDNAERCLDILKNVSGITGVFDPANFIQCGVDTLKAWDLLKDKIKYLHIQDALADGHVVPAGCGIGHVADIVKSYISLGGTAMTLEPHLTVFKGLKDLEQEGERSQVGEVYTYPDSNSAFDAASKAIKDIIQSIAE